MHAMRTSPTTTPESWRALAGQLQQLSLDYVDHHARLHLDDARRTAHLMSGISEAMRKFTGASVAIVTID